MIYDQKSNAIGPLQVANVSVKIWCNTADFLAPLTLCAMSIVCMTGPLMSLFKSLVLFAIAHR